MMSCPVAKKLVLIAGLRPFVHLRSQINWSLCIACLWATQHNPFPPLYDGTADTSSPPSSKCSSLIGLVILRGESQRRPGDWHWSDTGHEETSPHGSCTTELQMHGDPAEAGESWCWRRPLAKRHLQGVNPGLVSLASEMLLGKAGTLPAPPDHNLRLTYTGGSEPSLHLHFLLAFLLHCYFCAHLLGKLY